MKGDETPNSHFWIVPLRYCRKVNSRCWSGPISKRRGIDLARVKYCCRVFLFVIYQEIL